MAAPAATAHTVSYDDAEKHAKRHFKKHFDNKEIRNTKCFRLDRHEFVCRVRFDQAGYDWCQANMEIVFEGHGRVKGHLLNQKCKDDH